MHFFVSGPCVASTVSAMMAGPGGIDTAEEGSAQVCRVSAMPQTKALISECVTVLSLLRLLLILKVDSVLGLLVETAFELISRAIDSSGDMVGWNRIRAAVAMAGVAYSLLLSLDSSLHTNGRRCCCFKWVDFVIEVGNNLPNGARPGVFLTQISEILEGRNHGSSQLAVLDILDDLAYITNSSYSTN